MQSNQATTFLVDPLPLGLVNIQADENFPHLYCSKVLLVGDYLSGMKGSKRFTGLFVLEVLSRHIIILAIIAAQAVVKSTAMPLQLKLNGFIQFGALVAIVANRYRHHTVDQ